MASSSNETVNFWNMIPPGFRFDPKDEELITHYLVKKINGESLPPNKMHEAELYGVLGPQDLTLYYEPESENTWYFFTRLERLYENGDRPKRSAGNGYWKATGVDATIRNKQGITIGYRKALAFFIKIEPAPKNKNEPKGIKTPWLMHEFRLANDPSTTEPKPKRRKTNDHHGTSSQSQGSKPKNMLDGWVLCKVYRLARDVEVEAQNPAHQEEQHLHQEEEQHQAIEQPVALNNGANDLLQREVVRVEASNWAHQEEQHLHYHQEYHQGVEHVQHVSLNGANDLLIPSNEDIFQYLQRDVTVEAPNSVHQEEQHLQYYQEYHQGVEQHVALNGADDHLLIPEIEDSFEHLQRNEALPQFSPEELEFLSNIYPC